jgi:hypothetical protein
MLAKIIDIWFNKLKTPTEDSLSFEIIEGTNLFLTKNHENKIGLLIENTIEIPASFKLKNFDFIYYPSLINKNKNQEHRNCQLILANQNVDPEFLIKLLIGIFDLDNTKYITSTDLIKILNELRYVFDIESISENEIIGVWGELYFLYQVLGILENKNDLITIVNSWEGTSSRKKIDFRFLKQKAAFEIKTTKDDHRIHHISGHEQFLKPLGFDNLYFASIKIINDDAGYTCSDLFSLISTLLVNQELISIFKDKCILRGNSFCNNKIYRYTPRDTFSYYNSNSFTLPNIPIGVSKLEWEQDFDIVIQENLDLFSIIN